MKTIVTSAKAKRGAKPRIIDLVFASILLSTTASLAQPAESAPKSSAESTAGRDKPSTESPAMTSESEDDPEAKKAALALFNEARALYKKNQFSAALLKYEASYRKYHTWAARTSIGACLVKLQRYDEALDVFESTLRESGDKLPTAAKTSALEQIDVLRKETGAIVVTGATPGALVFVDGRLRGEHPLVTPASTLGGQHLLRIYKEGFEVYENDVNIPKGGMQTLEIKLRPLAHSGLLKVGETGGKKMEVVVDGVPVGVTPWEGPVSPGPHSVSLRPITVRDGTRGASCDSADVAANPDVTNSSELGTEPKTVIVKENATTPIALKAEPLGAVVRIVPNPPNAAVYVDGVYVGRGPYIGRAKPGKHVVATKADGYHPITQEVTAKAGIEAEPKVKLSKDLNSPKWVVRGRFVVEARGTVPLAPSFGGDIAALCTGDCQQSLGSGIRAALRLGYERANGFGFGVSGGYLQISQNRLGVPMKICVADDPSTCKGLPTTSPSWQSATANDETGIKGVALGAYGAYKLGRRFPIRVGLGAGVLLGQLDYSRTSIFQNKATGPLLQSGSTNWIYVEPEAQVGIQITEGFSIGASFSGMVLIAPSIPTWTDDMVVNMHGETGDAFGSFQRQTIVGGVFFAMSQGLYLQYGF